MNGWDQLLAKREPKYPCGHERTDENTLSHRFGGGYVARRCRACHLMRIKDWFGHIRNIPVRNASQWDAVYRGIIQHYRRKSYLARNPFFVEPYKERNV